MNRLISQMVVMVMIGAMLIGAADAEEVSTTSLREQTRKQLRLESTAETGTPKDDAATALCDLYVVLRGDARFQSSEMLQGDATKVRRRLLTIARRREIQLERQGIQRPSELGRQVDAAIKKSLTEEGNGSVDVVEGQINLNSDSAAGEASGGAGGSGGGAGGGGGGWQLVELIERIVAPDFWESRGGVGSIQYFAMRRVLVVRATSDVHQQIKDLLTALR